MSNRRKLWPSERQPPFRPAPVKARPRNKAAEDHSYHLLMLQQRNRLLKKLSQKEHWEIELEKKERGFSLYLNGANTAQRRVKKPRHTRAEPVKTNPTLELDMIKNKRPSRTAGNDEKKSPEQEVRSRTAPSKRKSWDHETVAVRSQDGPAVSITAPDIVSGCYEDDFESSAAELSEEEREGGGREGGEGEEGGRGEGGGEREGGSEEDSEVDELTVSFHELSELCSSLEETILTTHDQNSLSLSSDSIEEVEQEREEEEREEEEEEEEGGEEEREGEREERGDGVARDGEDIPDTEEDGDWMTDQNIILQFPTQTRSSLRTPPSDPLTHPRPPSPPPTHPSPPHTEHSVPFSTLSAISERVRLLDISEQRKLLRMLKSLDHTPLPPSAPPTQRSTHDWLTSPSVTVTGRCDGGRPISTRSTGLRGEMLRGNHEIAPDTNDPQLREQPIAYYGPSRSVSGRTSGLRGQLLGRTHSRDSLEGVHQSVHGSAERRPRPVSGRVTGLRGALASRDGESTITHTSSEPELHCPHSRLRTAVLACGHRPLRMGPRNSDMVCLPAITTPGEEGGERGQDTASPLPSSEEPQIRPHPSSDMEECLASISHFDHTHLGQLGGTSTDGEDILEAFLAEYRESRRERGHSELQTPPTLQLQAPLTLQLQAPPTLQPTEPERGGEEFCIPVLPEGRQLVLSLLSTWGDQFYIGLTGLEIFTASGERASIAQISADPADINVLPEYSGDPRVVTNLLDRANITRDDLHMWLAPYTPSHPHTVTITFTTLTTLALVRVWNYNKSRVHSNRGVRLMEMWLDGRLIFHGEIRRASGGITGGGHDLGETILFTTDEDVLSRVGCHDDCFQAEIARYHDNGVPQISDRNDTERPNTSDGREPGEAGEAGECGDGVERPFTSAHLPTKPHPQPRQLCGKDVQVWLVANWGAEQWVGLTGLELIGSAGQPLLLQLVSTDVQSVDHSTVQRLSSGDHLTTSESAMWRCPFSVSAPSSLTLSLPTPSPLHALRVWNYNASQEDSYCGVKVLHVCVDGVRVTPDHGVLVRRAPGHTHYDYAQDILLDNQHRVMQHSSCDQSCDQSCDLTGLPTGFVYQFQLLSTWGDPYYIGLNGLELCDTTGSVIPLSPHNVAAFPSSVNVLSGVSGDVRTPERLVDRVNDTFDGRHMWLAPILPHTVNSVYVIFDVPRRVGVVRLWNYSKTPSRGVREFTVLVDDQLVYSGVVPVVPSHARGILPTLHPPLLPLSISLRVGGASAEGEEGGMTSLTITRRPHPANQNLRPLTSLTHSQRNY